MWGPGCVAHAAGAEGERRRNRQVGQFRELLEPGHMLGRFR